MNYRELAANVIVCEQQINDINQTLKKLDDRQVTDGTAVRILTNARWNLCSEIKALQNEMGGTR